MMPIQTTTTSSFSEKRFDQFSWITLAIGLFLLALSAIVTIVSYRMPSDGWLVDIGEAIKYSNPVYVTNLQGTNPNIQPGDVLLEVEGQPFELLESRAASLRPQRPANWEIGDTVRYTILRDGSEMVVPVTLQRRPLATVFILPTLQSNGALLVSFVYLLIGGLLLFLRPRQRAAQLLFLGVIVLFTNQLVTWGMGVPAGVADLFSAGTYWPRIVIGGLIWILIWPILAHLFLIFPLVKRAVSRFHLIIPLIYILPFVVFLFSFSLSVLGYVLPDFIIAVSYNLLFLLIIGFSLIHSLLTIKEPVPRMQMRWIAFGGLVGIVGAMIFALIREIALMAIPSWSSNASMSGFWPGLILFLLSLVFPISLAIAILRYRLWDIEIIINRSLVYGTLTTALALIYFGSVVLLETLFHTLTGQGSPIAIVISTLIIAGLFSPLRRRAQRFIDRRFYRRKYDAEQILGQFAISVRDEPDLDRLTAELQRVTMAAMQANHVSIWLKESSQTKAD